MSDAAPDGFPYREKRGQTHYDDCFRVARHHNCAVARVEALEAEYAELRAAIDRLRAERRSAVECLERGDPENAVGYLDPDGSIAEAIRAATEGET